MYEPKPIDTSDVVLPAELLALTEKIAENVHEVWAAGRIAEGWTYGEKKDNDLKTTPLLVPYDELAESEKEYDRNTALETLKLIVKMGYRIELRDPTMIRMLENLTGVNARASPLDDPDTMSIFISSKVLGYENDEVLGPTGAVAIPEFNTRFTRQMLVDTQPKDFNTLLRLSGCQFRISRL